MLLTFLYEFFQPVIVRVKKVFVNSTSHILTMSTITHSIIVDNVSVDIETQLTNNDIVYVIENTDIIHSTSSHMIDSDTKYYNLEITYE